MNTEKLYISNIRYFQFRREVLPAKVDEFFNNFTKSNRSASISNNIPQNRKLPENLSTLPFDEPEETSQLVKS